MKHPSCSYIAIAAALAGAALASCTTDESTDDQAVGGSIVWRSTAKAGFTNTTSLTVAAPTGAAVGDVLVASLGFGESSLVAQPVVTPPAGWTLVGRANHGTVGALAVYWHAFAAGETTYTWTSNELVFGSGWISAYEGASTASPIDVGAGEEIATGGTAIATPSITTTGANEMIVASYAGVSTPAAMWTASTAMTERADANNADSRSGLGADAMQLAAGASGTKIGTPSVAQVYAMSYVLALKPAPATLAWRSTAQAAFTNTKSLTIAAPAGAAVGDVLIASLGFGESSLTAQPVVTPPAGWTLVGRANHGTVGALAVYWHAFAAGESTYSWSSSALVFGSGWISAYEGASTTNPIDVEVGQEIAVGGTAIATPSITTTGGNELLVASFAGVSVPFASWTAPTAMTERANANNADSRSGLGADRVQANAGATGSFTATASVAQLYAMSHLLALRPASGSSTTTTNGNVINYYVGTTNCSNSYSEAQARSAATPWCSIATADSKLVLGAGGTTVHVLPGAYSGPIAISKSGTAAARIVYLSDVKWGAKVTTMNWAVYGDYVDISGFDGSSANGPNGYAFEITSNDRLLDNYLHDFNVGGCAPAGVINAFPGNHSNTIRGNIIRHGGNYNPTYGSVTSNNCVVFHGIYIGPTGLVLEDNIISGITGWGIKLDVSPGNCGQAVVSGNTLFNNGGGIDMTEYTDAGFICALDYQTIANNIIVDNGVDEPGGGRFGIDFYHVTGTHNLVTNNLIYGNKPTDYAHHDAACTGGTPISGSDANGTAGGCPSTNPSSDSSTSVTFASFQFDGNSAPATSYNALNYALKSGSSAVDSGTTSCAGSPGTDPCVPTVDFQGGARPINGRLDRGAFELGSTAATWPY